MEGVQDFVSTDNPPQARARMSANTMTTQKHEFPQAPLASLLADFKGRIRHLHRPGSSG